MRIFLVEDFFNFERIICNHQKSTKLNTFVQKISTFVLGVFFLRKNSTYGKDEVREVLG